MGKPVLRPREDIVRRREGTAAGGCVAGIVLFKPDASQVRANLAALLDQVDLLILYLNSPLSSEDAASFTALAEPDRLLFLGDGSNRGLGVAYNAMAELARAREARHLLLLDQDSSPTIDLLPGLVDAFRRLMDAGKTVATVGPAIQTLTGEAHQPPRPPRPSPGPIPGILPAEAVISSGSLISMDALSAVGPFRDDFFIDMIDTEWSLRAWTRGYGTWMTERVSMRHALGGGTVRAFGSTIVLHSPARLYTAIRNQTAMLRLRHVPWRWRAIFLASLPLRVLAYLRHAPARHATLKAIWLGIFDGVRGKLGDPQHRWREFERSERKM